MLWMRETVYGNRKAVVMYSGFCVSRGIVELEWKGVYGESLITKKKYWTKGVSGAPIDAHFEDKDVNYCEMLEASIDGLHFQVMCMKEPNYVMKIMCKWITLDDFEGGQTRRTILWTASRQPILSAISSCLGCTTSSDINLMTTITWGICLYRLRGHGLPSFGKIETVHGI